MKKIKIKITKDGIKAVYNDTLVPLFKKIGVIDISPRVGLVNPTATGKWYVERGGDFIGKDGELYPGPFFFETKGEAVKSEEKYIEGNLL